MMNAYIGLTDEVTRSVYVWVDGSSLSYSNWYLTISVNVHYEILKVNAMLLDHFDTATRL